MHLRTGRSPQILDLHIESLGIQVPSQKVIGDYLCRLGGPSRTFWEGGSGSLGSVHDLSNVLGAYLDRTLSDRHRKMCRKEKLACEKRRPIPSSGSRVPAHGCGRPHFIETHDVMVPCEPTAFMKVPSSVMVTPPRLDPPQWILPTSPPLRSHTALAGIRPTRAQRVGRAQPITAAASTAAITVRCLCFLVFDGEGWVGGASLFFGEVLKTCVSSTTWSVFSSIVREVSYVEGQGAAVDGGDLVEVRVDHQHLLFFLLGTFTSRLEAIAL